MGFNSGFNGLNNFLHVSQACIFIAVKVISNTNLQSYSSHTDGKTGDGSRGRWVCLVRCWESWLMVGRGEMCY